MSLRGKTVLVTGASRGIGRAAALGFAAAGANVVLAARGAEELAPAAREVESRGATALAVPLDVCADDSVARAVATATRRFGGVDVLVNNAGIAGQGMVVDRPLEEVRGELDTNFLGVVRVTRALLPQMIERGSGVILNVASVAGRVAYPSMASYAASKAALLAWSDALRGEVAHHGVRVVSVVPGHSSGGNGPNVRLDGPTLETPAEIARTIVRAALRPRREVVSGRPNRVFLFVARLAPALAASTMLHFAKSSLPAGTFTRRARAPRRDARGTAPA